MRREKFQVKKRLHTIFSGAVQGVGFRFTTERIARRFPVTGFVRNLPEGKVEVVAEGEEVSVQEFVAGLREAFSESIQGVETEWSEAAGEFKGFGIKF